MPFSPVSLFDYQCGQFPPMGNPRVFPTFLRNLLRTDEKCLDTASARVSHEMRKDYRKYNVCVSEEFRKVRKVDVSRVFLRIVGLEIPPCFIGTFSLSVTRCDFPVRSEKRRETTLSGTSRVTSLQIGR